MEKYLKEEELGAGSFGIVYKAKEIATNRVVAIKRIRVSREDDGLHFSALREIKFLTDFKHPNLIDLVDTFVHEKALHLVFDYMATDLEKVIKDQSIFLSSADVMCYIQMLLQSVDFCHKNFILHRDIKPSNLLISAEGTLKLADFGLARQYGSPSDRLTSNVVTRWYRSPELLYGAKKYGTGIDIWSVGCVFAELLRRNPLFPGDNEIGVLSLIFHTLGTPTEKVWPDMVNLPNYIAFTEFAGFSMTEVCPTASPEAIDLLKKMLAFDPSQRISAADALNHSYFKTLKPTAPQNLKLPIRRKFVSSSVTAVPTRQARNEVRENVGEVKRKLFE